jgi:hypothetical protein
MILSLVVSGGPSRASQTPAATTSVRDIDGHRFNLVGQDTKAKVLFFITTDCPIANSYLPEINRIVTGYEPRKVAFYAVYTDPTVSMPAIRKHAHEFGLRIPLIPDTTHDLVHRVGATVTPEVAVLNEGGRLVYRGRIDDWYVDFGKRRSAPTRRYLQQALDAVLSGKPVAIPNVDPIGCSIFEAP